MRLWHQDLLIKLPRQQLLGQWREVAALLNGGWGRKHRTVDYVFKYNKDKLVAYGYKVAIEMIRRGYKPNLRIIMDHGKLIHINRVYPEHNESYLQECIDNLAGKGIKIVI